MNKTIAIVLAVVLLVVGVAAGYLAGMAMYAPKLQQTQSIVAKMQSKVIGSIVAFGQVAKINGRTITLVNGANKDTLAIVMKDNASVMSMVSATDKGAVATSQQKASFADIKTGAFLNVSVKVMTNGQIEGQSAIIFPNFTSTANK